jgi:hypothetical protein
MESPIQIPLVNGGFALVDGIDAERVNQHQWLRGGEYVVTGNQPVTIYLHRFILEITDSRVLVDHRDLNPLNNVRTNLRIATPSRNAANKRKQRGNYGSAFKGVYPVGRRYRAQITFEGRCRSIGYYPTAEDAARAYDAKAVELFGEFARLNFDSGIAATR